MIPLPTHDSWAPPAEPGADVAAFARRSGLELLRFAYLLCGDRHRAEDLLQDVLLSMYRRFPDELPLDNPVGVRAAGSGQRKRQLGPARVQHRSGGESVSRRRRLDRQ